jgi:hypothetical protein
MEAISGGGVEMGYVRRLVKGNVRLIVLALVASAGFIFTEFWRNEVQGSIADLDKLRDATTQILQRLSMAELQRDLGRATAVTGTNIEIANAAMDGVKAAPDADFKDLFTQLLAARERLQRIALVYSNDADIRSIEMNSLAAQIGTSSIRPRDMPPTELPPPAYTENLTAQCLAAYWPEAPAPVRDALLQFNPRQPPAAPKRLSDQFIHVAEEGQRLYSGLTGFQGAVLTVVNTTTPEQDKAGNVPVTMAEQTSAALRGTVIYTSCIDTIMRAYSAQLSVFLRNYQGAVVKAREPLAEKQSLLRYVSYLIAIIAFFASNLKPAAQPHAAPQGPSVEPHRLAAAGAQQAALPHDAAAANDGAHRPAGDGDSVIRRPPDT